MRLFLKKEKKSFTLIELLVVIAIMSLLSSIVFSSINSARARARDARRVSDIAQIQKALDLYYDANGRYPLSQGTAGTSYENYFSTNDAAGWATFEAALAPYIKTLPKDPINTASVNSFPSNSNVYNYAYLSRGPSTGCLASQVQQWYVLWFRTESMTLTSPGGPGCNGTPYNFGNGSITVGRQGQ